MRKMSNDELESDRTETQILNQRCCLSQVDEEENGGVWDLVPHRFIVMKTLADGIYREIQVNQDWETQRNTKGCFTFSKVKFVEFSQVPVGSLMLQ